VDDGSRAVTFLYAEYFLHSSITFAGFNPITLVSSAAYFNRSTAKVIDRCSLSGVGIKQD
jgi:hypothetical protein